jgi:RPA family protein
VADCWDNLQAINMRGSVKDAWERMDHDCDDAKIVDATGNLVFYFGQYYKGMIMFM